MTRTVASPSGLRIEPPIQPGDDSAAVMRSRIVASHSDSEPSLTTTRVITDSMSSAPLVENADYAARRSARGLGGRPTWAQGRATPGLRGSAELTSSRNVPFQRRLNLSAMPTPSASAGSGRATCEHRAHAWLPVHDRGDDARLHGSQIRRARPRRVRAQPQRDGRAGLGTGEGPTRYESPWREGRARPHLQASGRLTS